MLLLWFSYKHWLYQLFENLQVLPDAHVVHPTYDWPPHCPYFATEHPPGLLGLVGRMDVVAGFPGFVVTGVDGSLGMLGLYLALIRSAAFSAIAYTVAHVFVAGIMGMMLMSPILNPVTPYTVRSELTTPAKSCGAMAAVQQLWAVEDVMPCTAYCAIC